MTEKTLITQEQHDIHDLQTRMDEAEKSLALLRATVLLIVKTLSGAKEHE